MKRNYLSLDSGCDHDKTRNSTSYILNERLFPVPMHEFEEEGHCPVCEGPNDPDSGKEPTRFIRWGGTVHTCSYVCIHDWNVGKTVLVMSYGYVQVCWDCCVDNYAHTYVHSL